MKNIIILTLLVFTSVAQCQTANIITETEYNNIEINGIKYIDLKNTLGDQNAVETLFGTANTIEKDDDPVYGGGYIMSIDFYYTGLEFSFYEEELSGFEITNSNSFVTIQGVTVTIGDNISLLGNVVFNTMNNGNQSIVYQYCDGCNNFISIRFNQTTKIITKIIYIEMT